MSDLPGTDADANFVANMKSAREARGWTQARLANAVAHLSGDAMTQSTISRIEKGDRPVRLNEARAIARAFGASVDQLSDTTESFARVLAWNKVYGDFLVAEDALEAACVAYELARRDLAGYLDAPEVEIGHQRMVLLRREVETTAADLGKAVAAAVEEDPEQLQRQLREYRDGEQRVVRIEHGEHPEAT